MIGPQGREKIPLWSTPPRLSPNGPKGLRRATGEGQSRIALCLEQTKGALVDALLEYPFLVLYPVNPATAARYRQAFKSSRAKNDPSDAQVCWKCSCITETNSLPGGQRMKTPGP